MSDSSSAATVEEAPVEAPPATERETKRDTKRKRQPRYHVILWNDNDHTYEYVVVMLRKLFAHPL